MSQESDSDTERYDVLQYSDSEYKAMPAGDGKPVVDAHLRQVRRNQFIATLTVAIALPAATVYIGTKIFDALSASLIVGLLAGLLGAVVRFQTWGEYELIPELITTDVPPRVVETYVSDFDPDEVTDPFK